MLLLGQPKLGVRNLGVIGDQLLRENNRLLVALLGLRQSPGSPKQGRLIEVNVGKVRYTIGFLRNGKLFQNLAGLSIFLLRIVRSAGIQIDPSEPAVVVGERFLEPEF